MCPITQFEGKALVFNNGVVDVQQDGVSVVDENKIAHITPGEMAIDELTIIKNADQELEVPFDNDTIYRDPSDGFIKARSSDLSEGDVNEMIDAKIGSEVSDAKIILCTQVGSDPAGPVGSFTLNQDSNKTITIPIPQGDGSSYTAGDGISISNDEIALDQQWLLENGDVAHAASATNAVNAMNARSAQEADQIDGHYYSDITDLIDAKQDSFSTGDGLQFGYNEISLDQSWLEKNGRVARAHEADNAGNADHATDAQYLLASTGGQHLYPFDMQDTYLQFIEDGSLHYLTHWNYFYVDFYNQTVDMSQKVLSYLMFLYSRSESMRLAVQKFPLEAIYICNWQRQWRHYALDEHGVPDSESEMVTTDLGPAYNVVPAQIRIVPEGIPDYWRKSYYWDEEKQEGFDCWPYTTPANYFVFQLDPDKAAEGLNGGDLFTGHITGTEGNYEFVVDYMNVSMK